MGGGDVRCSNELAGTASVTLLCCLTPRPGPPVPPTLWNSAAAPLADLCLPLPSGLSPSPALLSPLLPATAFETRGAGGGGHCSL